MKAMLRFMCLVVMALVFSACSGNGPDRVAVDFTKALYTGDTDQAVTYCTEETKGLVGIIMGFASSKIDEMKKTNPDIKVLSSEVSEDGNSAKVEIEIQNYFDLQKGEVNEETQKETVELTKVNDEWKVALRK